MTLMMDIAAARPRGKASVTAGLPVEENERRATASPPRLPLEWSAGFANGEDG